MQTLRLLFRSFRSGPPSDAERVHMLSFYSALSFMALIVVSTLAHRPF